MFQGIPFKVCQLTAILAACLTVGCGRRDANMAWWAGEQERVGLTQQLALKEFRLERLGSNDLPELERIRATNKTLAESRVSLASRKAALGEECGNMQEELAGFRTSILQDHRHRMIGRKFDELGVLSGRTYRQVIVASIDDAGVSIRHADGSARLRFEDLDTRQRLQFGLEQDLAMSAVEQESAEAAAYERWIEERMIVLQEKQEREADAAMKDALAAKRARSLQASQDRLAANTRPLARPATSVGSGYSSYYSTYRAYRPTYRYVYYTPAVYRPYQSAFCVPNYGTITPRYVTPTVVPRRTSFANTTIPYIP